jgi:hypothetical protein
MTIPVRMCVMASIVFKVFKYRIKEYEKNPGLDSNPLDTLRYNSAPHPILEA